MREDKIKTIAAVGLMVVVVLIALSLLKWMVRLLLPFAIVIIAGYIVYKVVSNKRV